MGILLAFMFLVNLFGAVSLLPALAAWLGVEEEERARVAADVAAGADTAPPAHALKSDAA
ncbi:hypothetical protein D3C81_1797290 [compost metagenome]